MNEWAQNPEVCQIYDSNLSIEKITTDAGIMKKMILNNDPRLLLVME